MIWGDFWLSGKGKNIEQGTRNEECRIMKYVNIQFSTINIQCSIDEQERNFQRLIPHEIRNSRYWKEAKAEYSACNI